MRRKERRLRYIHISATRSFIADEQGTGSTHAEALAPQALNELSTRDCSSSLVISTTVTEESSKMRKSGMVTISSVCQPSVTDSADAVQMRRRAYFDARGIRQERLKRSLLDAESCGQATPLVSNSHDHRTQRLWEPLTRTPGHGDVFGLGIDYEAVDEAVVLDDDVPLLVREVGGVQSVAFRGSGREVASRKAGGGLAGRRYGNVVTTNLGPIRVLVFFLVSWWRKRGLCRQLMMTLPAIRTEPAVLRGAACGRTPLGRPRAV